MGNIFDLLSGAFEKESFTDLINHEHVRIEQIISKGHTSPDEGWYDQEENEWVIVLKGSGLILFENGNEILLNKGDYLNLPAHTKHKVKWTDPKDITVWLAVFY